MPSPKTLLVTGASGNLGSRFARRLVGSQHRLRLMVHRTPLADDLVDAPNVAVTTADLGRPETLRAAVAGADVVIHFAGVLFAPRPERFLPVTNTLWFDNLLESCLDARVARVVLISFAHVEGPTSPEQPAAGRLDREPVSVHARTRLEEERRLLARTQGSSTTPVVVRLGMVYGRGILMVDAAHWLAERRLLGVWREPTWVHLVSEADALEVMTAAALKDGIEGIFHVGD
ncbi:MAG: NAD(P)-dependent oxidoreductase, partial [Polyangiaceae bacterium]|nr:NAD(P)-dependent oxidoreductase [Polyangiaceae bacterium]